MDTRTSPDRAGGRAQGIEDPILSPVKVPSDPAQVTVNHASFRVMLARTPRPSILTGAGTGPLPIVPTSVRTASDARTPLGAAAGFRQGGRGNASPWAAVPGPAAGGTDPDGTETTQRMPVLRPDAPHPDTAGTRLLPQFAGPDEDGGLHDTRRVRPLVVSQRDPRGPHAAGPVHGGAHDAHDRDAYGDRDTYDGDREAYDDRDPYGRQDGLLGLVRLRGRSEPVRHAFYPGHRMNLGLVLLPLRVFLGFVSVYAGMSKLCDPVFFGGGDRGSMVQWLSSLEPWTAAEPLRDFALTHPVGAGLAVAFLQIVVGTLTMLGLWTRLAAGAGILLSAALLLTVSWRSAPAYNMPDFIYLAAWSPLLIAGAPVYSLDARLAGEAWRTLGPRAPIADLRRRVLRRGTVLAVVVVGMTLLLGSLLGGAVRSGSTTIHVPGPSDPPVNNLPGSPLPTPTGGPRGGTPSPGGNGRGPASPSAIPSERASSPAAEPAPDAGTTGGGVPQPDGPTVQAPQEQAPPPAPREPAPTPPSAGNGGTSGGGGGSDEGSSGGGSGSGGAIGGLLGSGESSGFVLGMREKERGEGTAA
ncbi:DoxX family protein [Streptomyces sp. HB2AG]|uniref:DoxX family protein n=1 Tax=Streptomyces sp. HB2AG TaxID=2983400 RepID=UPI0022AAA489|nr:DoxX family protein [Streptomyces sp. HB2AG]MCZ2526726.1 DoxX family protein [Streptomyces sp. HB2AG]